MYHVSSAKKAMCNAPATMVGSHCTVFVHTCLLTVDDRNQTLHCGQVSACNMCVSTCGAVRVQNEISFCRWFVPRLSNLTHANSAPLCVLYSGHPDAISAPEHNNEQHSHQQHSQQHSQGPVVTFNVLRPDGSFFGYRWALHTLQLCGSCIEPARWRQRHLINFGC